jgi:MiaB-like tRNA modifying enzyme
VRFDAIVGPALGNEIVNIANRVADGEKIIALENALEAKPSLDLPRLRLNPVISIVPVSYGCLGSCAYCCVVFARGRLRSYSREEIVNRVRKDLASGAKEVWITAQDTASYGLDKKTSLAELLGNLCKIEGDFKVRVGMMTPNIALSILKELVRSFRDEHVFKFLHLPVQSGDDKVLERMHRSYSVDDFRKIVDAFRGEFPSLTLSTDIICGFPGESEEAFDRTLGLIEGVRPDVVNVSKFFARPRTLALEMKEEFVPYHEVKRRSARAAALVKRVSLEKNREWTDWTGEILVDEKGKIPDSWIGRNFAYKPVVAKSQDYLLGKQMRVKVSKVFSTYLESEIIG